MKLVQYHSVAKRSKTFGRSCEELNNHYYLCRSSTRSTLYYIVGFLLRATSGYSSHYDRAERVDDIVLIRRELGWPTAACRVYYSVNRVYVATCTGLVCEDLEALLELLRQRYRIRFVKVAAPAAVVCGLDRLSWLRRKERRAATISYYVI